MKNLLAFLVTLFFSTFSIAQSDSCSLKLSLLTCGPGEDLYSVFGHSALRVHDTASGTDIIYNYGTFDFEDPDFYVKFVLGKLLYYVSTEQFDNFVYSYQLEERYIIEQNLALSCQEKHKLAAALATNALEQNKYYEYEFLFDNCSTRLRDIVENNTEDTVRYKRIIPTPAPTFRNMLHDYLDRGEQHWSKFGIDLLLASRIDRKVQNREAMFLPDYLMKGFDSSIYKGNSLVRSKQLILPAPSKQGNAFNITPMMVTIALLVVGVALTVWKRFGNKLFADIFDGLLFFLLGVMGCLMLFMWYGTEHELCRNNYNLYWALPTHIIAAFIAGKNLPIVRKYFSLSAIIAVVFVLCWPFLPQGMNSAFLPLVLLSAIRSYDRTRKS